MKARPTRYILISLLALACAACATTDRPDYRPLEPGVLFSEKPAKTGQRDQGGLQPDTGKRATPAEIAEEIKRRDDALNAKLSGVLGRESRKGPAADREEARAVGGPRQRIEVDFLDAEISEVVTLFMGLLHRNYSLHPGVTGRVSLSVKDEFTTDQIADLLEGVLRINALTMLERDGVWEILPMALAPQLAESGDMLMPSPDGSSRPVRGQMVRAYRLRYIGAGDFMNVIKPFLTKNALAFNNDQSGVLLVSDYPHNLVKITRFLELLDVSALAGLNLKAFSLKYVVAEDMVKDLDALAKTTGMNPAQGAPLVSFLALERLNMVLVVSKRPGYLEFVDAWIDGLDRETPKVVKEGREENIFVYYVQNGDAIEIVASLEGIFGGGTGTRGRSRSRSQTSRGSLTTSGSRAGSGSTTNGTFGTQDSRTSPLGMQQGQSPQAPFSTNEGTQGGLLGTQTGAVSGYGSSGRGGESFSTSGPVNFVVDETTNSIITSANPTDYKKISALIEKLDIYPKQVLIEVVIADVTLTDATKLGVEWQALFGQFSVGVDNNLGVVSTTSSPNIASGLSLTLDSQNVKAALKALASDDRTQILSSPHILASNHKEAKIDVGQEVPIVTSQRTTDPASGGQTTDATIQYRNTGILLAVIPHINEQGLVRMEISQEVSAVSDQTVQGVNSPVFTKRLATTTAVINDEQTVVIGGLIQQQNTHNESNVPGVRRIPLLKYLFGYEADQGTSTELLIFITPHVVESREDNDIISANFVSRLEELKKSIRYEAIDAWIFPDKPEPGFQPKPWPLDEPSAAAPSMTSPTERPLPAGN